MAADHQGFAESFGEVLGHPKLGSDPALGDMRGGGGNSDFPDRGQGDVQGRRRTEIRGGGGDLLDTIVGAAEQYSPRQRLPLRRRQSL